MTERTETYLEKLDTLSSQPSIDHYPVKPYEFSSHTLVSKLIHGNGNNILDMGCGQGAIEELVDITQNVFVGLDCRLPQGTQDKFQEFIVHDLEDGLPVPELQDKQFDYILLLDILEHLVNPTTILRDLHNISGPDTKIIISVPNIANIYVRLGLFFGRFEYADRGILDRTHLRFFTKSSLRRWVTENDFVIKQQLNTIIPLNEIFKQQTSNLWLKAANHILYFFTNLFDGLLAYQFILVAQKKDGAG